jgi:hypothetical protein
MSTDIRISQAEFEQLFPDYPELYELLVTKPASRDELIQHYLPSKLWRLNNLYTIIDKDGNHVRFKMNRAQFKVYAKLLKHPRLLILKSRQQGISTFFLLYFFDDAIFTKHLSVGLMAQGRDEASKLLERIKFSWDHFPQSIRSLLNINHKKSNSFEFSFDNNSSIFIRTSFRSATLQRLHISEFGKIANASPKKAQETKTGSLQTIAVGNIVIIESTAEGNNEFKFMWDKAVELQKKGRELAAKDMLPVFLSWLDDPTCIEPVLQEDTEESRDYFKMLDQLGLTYTQEQRNYWIVQYRELEDSIYQEYPATAEEAFRAGKNGTYWSKRYIKYIVQRKRIRKNLWDRNLPVYAMIDPGRDDYFVFVFFQVYNKTIRIIGEFQHSGEGLDYYATYLLEEVPKEWQIETIYVPHDFGVKDLSVENNKTRQEVWEDYGITNTQLLDKEDLAAGIELVRQYIPVMYIDVECSYIESCFLNYSKKWDPKLLKWSKDPVHDQYSHGADCLRGMCQAIHLYHNDIVSLPSPSQAQGVAL